MAVANWVIVHSAQLGAQMPTRWPFSTPSAISAAGTAVDLGLELAVGVAEALVAGDERLVVAYRVTV